MMVKFITFKVGLGIGILAVALVTPANLPTSRLMTINYGPYGTIDHSRPKIAWKLGTEGSKITAFGMAIDGRPVRPSYIEDRTELNYSTRDALAPGTHRIDAFVVLNGMERYEKKWEVEISSVAAPSFPVAGTAQTEAVSIVNKLRADIQLPPLKMDAGLNFASTNHAEYLSKNRKSGHFQTPGDHHFFGQTIGDRLGRVGYVGAGCETVTNNIRRIGPAIHATFDAPYHRIAFMNPESGVMGVGHAEKHLAMTFQAGGQSGEALSPAPNQTDIPIGWVDREIPSPLAGTGLTDVGYPIVAHFAGLKRADIASVTATLSGFSAADMIIRSPLGDKNLVRSVVLIPARRLAYETTYTVHVELTTQRGEQIVRRWSFTTESKRY